MQPERRAGGRGWSGVETTPFRLRHSGKALMMKEMLYIPTPVEDVENCYHLVFFDGMNNDVIIGHKTSQAWGQVLVPPPPYVGMLR